MYSNNAGRSFGDIMRYTEKEYDFEYTDMKAWLQNVAALFIVAPLRLFNEISTKIVYLNRSLIIKILNLTVILNLLFVSVAVGVNYWLGDLNIWLGKIPIVLQIASLIITIIINLWYRFYDFMIYQQLDKLLPLRKNTTAKKDDLESSGISKSEDLNAFDNNQTKDNDSFEEFEDSLLTELTELNIPDIEPKATTMDVGSIAARLAEEPLILNEHNDTNSNVESKIINTIDLSEIDETLLDILNEDLLDDTTTIDYQHMVDSEVANLTAVEDKELEQEMDDVTDPSKYVSEEGLFKFLSTIGLDSFGTLDSMDGWETPDSFNLTN